jgi:amidophosphoribosyltransferase
MFNQDLSKPREYCGIAGVFGVTEAATEVYLMLHALQHRGQEGAGIVVAEGSLFNGVRGQGLVSELFDEKKLQSLTGSRAVGHVRYSTTGPSVEKNAQPLMIEYALGNLAVAHNGNIVNAAALRRELECSGSIFQTTSDTEVIVHLMAKNQHLGTTQAALESLRRIQGAYCLVMLTDTGMMVARDPRGFRPLALGRLQDGYVVASETCAFDLVGAKYWRDVEPGEMLVIDASGVQSYKIEKEAEGLAHCIFEYIYFSRPDSMIFYHSCWTARKELGRQLARESAVAADVVVPVPDSGVCSAIGYAEQAKLPFEMALIRNHYVGRTFIEPSQSIRDFGVKLKFNCVQEAVKNKRVVVIDDSLVRGTTMRKIIKMIRAGGAKEIHVRLSSPAVIAPCFYGMDFPTRKELIAATHTLDEIAKYLRVDSVAYLSVEGMLAAMPQNEQVFCRACFTGHYPVDFSGREKMAEGEIANKEVARSCGGPLT